MDNREIELIPLIVILLILDNHKLWNFIMEDVAKQMGQRG